MPFYQNSVVNKHLNTLDKAEIKSAYQRFVEFFHNSERQQNIRDAKEEQFQEGFLTALFVDVLGYVINPNPNYNLTTEYKNENGAKKADGAIIKDGKAIAVIELKGTDTKDLDKVNEQAFNYKNNQSACVYVITSNFEKLRFFIQNSVEFIEFNLFTITETEFELLWLCLNAESLFAGLPQIIKNESLSEEATVTKNLYKDYSTFKQELWQNIVSNLPDADQLLLYKKTQKLLDRFLFIFFAEDSGLLPPNSITRMVERWTLLKEEDAYKPLYQIFKQFFGYINTGRKGKTTQNDIFAYNGGLFLHDDVLDADYKDKGLNSLVDDEILHKHVVKMTSYDFETEVDVNILGHIFENSLNDIENVTARLKGKEIDKNKTKRKKDGVFYTPKYITKYIVENTIGKLCQEKKAELNIVDKEYAKGKKNRKKDTIAKLDKNLQTYREWLLKITICDPACGSGAFLNQALEFLINEHAYIDQLEALLVGTSMVFRDVSSHILEQNLYGVDINEESVDIAKLSLWLRTAQRGRKLTSLNNNIKCGNSLIDDPKVAGDKAFYWQTEFPEVFKEKEKKAFHITTAIHDSRTSERMIEHKVRLKRDDGTKPHANPIWLKTEDEIEITKTVCKIVEEDKLNVLAYNICGDHMHLLLVCEKEEVDKIIGKIKAVTAKKYNLEKGITIPAIASSSSFTTTRGHVPLSEPEPEQKHGYEKEHVVEHEKGNKKKYNSLWTQKFGCKEVLDEEQLQNTLNYIQHNREKHNLPQSKELQALVTNICTDQTHAFRTEYKGGFDVVIGNPPYVHLEKIKNISNSLENIGYETFDKRGDIYCVFVEKGMRILKYKGLISYIMPNKWMQAGYGKSLRTYFLKHNLMELIDFGDIQIFEGATTYPCIFVCQRTQPQMQFPISILQASNLLEFKYNVAETAEIFNTNSFSSDTWIISSNKEQVFLEKLNSKFKTLSNFINGDAYYGIKTGLTEAFLLNEKTKAKLVSEDLNSLNVIKPFLQGRDISKYSSIITSSNIIFFEKGITNRNIEKESEATEWISTKYPAIFNWLEPFKEKAKQRTDKGDYWWELRACDYYVSFDKPKIMYQTFQVKPCFIYDTLGLYCNNSMWIIPTDNKALLGILNSKMGWWLITKYCTQIQSGYQLIWKYFSQIPIPKTDLSILTPSVEEMISFKNNEQQISDGFTKLFSSRFLINNLSKKLQNWHKLEFNEFLKELEKARKKAAKEQGKEYKLLPLAEQAEWMEYFTEQKTKVEELQQQIDKTDKEIDQMVYKLYDLTEEEIKIVEES